MRFTQHKPTADIKPLKKGNKLKGTLIFFFSALAFFLVACASYGVYSFFYNYSLQSPIIFQSPIVSKHKDVIISPVATGSAKTSMLIDLGAIADKIYTLESSGGKNDGCRKLGLFNGYGFSQSTFHWNCYTSHEEVRQLVINWLEDHIGKYGLEKSLCIYNRGVNEIGCTYSMNYLSLK